MAMKRIYETTWYVRVASLLVAVWAVWLLAFNVWSLTVDEPRSETRTPATRSCRYWPSS